MQNGQPTLVKRSSAINKMTKMLTDQHWKDIIEAAMEYTKTAVVSPEDTEIFAEESSDFELEDGDYDADSDRNLDTEGDDDAFANMEEQDPYRWRYAGSDEDAEVDQLEGDD